MSHPNHHHRRHHEDDERVRLELLRVERELTAQGHTLADIRILLNEIVVGMSATGFDLRQLDFEGDIMAIDPTKDGVALGTTGFFSASTLPIGGKLKLGTVPAFSTGDTSVTLSASPDGDPFKVAAAVAATETLPSFGITVSGTSLDGTAISHNFSVPVLPAGTTGGTPAVDFDLIQIPNPVATPPPPPPTGVVASPSSVSLSLAAGSTQQLTATDVPSGDVTASSTYVSDNTSVATVNAAGVVTPVAVGSANITITDPAGNLAIVPVTVAA